MSIRAKVMIAIAGCMGALALATGALVRTAGERTVRLAAEQAIAAAGGDLAALERSEIDKLDAALTVLAGHPALVDAFAARDRGRLLAVAAPLFAALKDGHDVSHLYFIEPGSGRVLLRVHRPDERGDVLHRATYLRAVDTGAMGAGKELGQNSFALRVVRPWYGRDGALIGYAELAEATSHFLDRMKQQTGDDYALLVEKVFLDRQAWAKTRSGQRNNWDDRARAVVVDSTIADEEVVQFDGDASSVPDRGLYLDALERDGKRYVRGIVPVKDAAGRRVGGLFVLHDITELHASMVATQRGLYALLAGVAAVLAVLLVALVNGVVLRRLDRVAGELEVLSGRFVVGDYEVRVPKATRRDELGRFEAALGVFVQRVVSVLKEAGRKRTG